MVLPNGLEFIVVLLAIAAAGLIAAPLNPAYKANELRMFLEDIQPRAVIVGSSTPAVIEAAAGRSLAIRSPPVIVLHFGESRRRGLRAASAY